MSEGIITRRASDIRPLLLDRFRNAAAAYSLRPLTLSGQDNPVVKVRRDSDNAEQDFSPAEINDGSLLTFVGNTASDNGFVTTWYDQSGNSNDATQATAGSQPKIVSGGSLVTENGKSAIDFDGSDDSFTIGNVPFYSNTNGQSIAAVYKSLNADTNASLITKYSAVNNKRQWVLNNDRYNVQETATAFNSSNQAVGLNTQAQQLSFGIWNPATSTTLYQNSTNVYTATTPATDIETTDVDVFIGKATDLNPLFTGVLQELIIYPSDQSDKRQQIESNINNHYGIY